MFFDFDKVEQSFKCQLKNWKVIALNISKNIEIEDLTLQKDQLKVSKCKTNHNNSSSSEISEKYYDRVFICVRALFYIFW